MKADVNADARLFTGLICGHRIEEMDNQMKRQERSLDNLLDEFAKVGGHW